MLRRESFIVDVLIRVGAVTLKTQMQLENHLLNDLHRGWLEVMVYFKAC
jgi:hypothetical protein